MEKIQSNAKEEVSNITNSDVNKETKFCKHCGGVILKEAVLCPKCGLQVEEIKQNESIIINNSNTNSNSNKANINTVGGQGKEKNKWVAFALCLFLGVFGAHKFYEGKKGMGILYLCSGGLFGIGAFIDATILLFFKPNPYYV